MLAADRDHEAVEAARLQHGAQAGEAPGVDRIGGRVGAGHAAFLVPTPLPILPCGGRRSGVVSMAGIWRLAAAIATLLLVPRSEEHTSELQSLMRLSYAVFCLTKKNKTNNKTRRPSHRDT